MWSGLGEAEWNPRRRLHRTIIYPRGVCIMGMSSHILDREEQFWGKANTVIGECEHFHEFVAHMKRHRDLLQGTGDEDHFEDALAVAWDEKWSKYAHI